MAKYYISLLLLRVVLPTALLLSIALRPFGLSILYLLLYLLSPLISAPDSKTFNGWRGKIILLNVIVSWILLTLHIIWHILLAVYPPYGSLLDTPENLLFIPQNLGLASYKNIDPWMAVHYLSPELVMTITSTFVYITLKKLLTGVRSEGAPPPNDSKYQKHPLLISAGKYISLFLIMFSGIMRPSIPSAIYFLVFMGATTAWAMGRPLERAFAVVCRCIMAIMAIHVAILILYQCTWLLHLLPPDSPFARYFGLTKLVVINETSAPKFTYMVTLDNKWATIASPLVILFTYYILAFETKELFKPKPKNKSALTGAGLESGKLNGSLIRGLSIRRSATRRSAARDKWMSATKKARVACPYINMKALLESPGETTPLMGGISQSKGISSIRSASGVRKLHQDSTGSVVVPDDESMMDQEEPTLMDDIISAIIDFFQVLIRSSYIATSITMMAWSIMFHSWLTFVFLMWANIVWLCQDQRSFMLKTSPVLVCYAMFLLLLQYIYGMDLTNIELPSNITAVNLRQIGVGRVEGGEPCVPLLIKSLFTCMFWVTLRQRMQEMRQRRRSAVVAEMAAPLQLTVSTAASAIEGQREEEGRSRLLRAFGDWLRAACARYWIYVVVIMLFVIGITGDRMTIFRIIYMFLFLTFILMFQISWYWWRKLMYMFWITLIIYSMINLILLYIYQFDNFAEVIEEYCYINPKLQHDLGLEPYNPADLFAKLLIPTLFLIITIMQVHYFHKDFLALSDPRTRTNSLAKGSSRPSQTGVSTMKDDLPALPLEEPPRSPAADSQSVTEADQSIEMSSFNADKSARRSAFRSKSSRSRSYAATITERPSVTFRDWWKREWQIVRANFLICRNLTFMYLEIHLIKIIFISLMLLCVTNVCAMHVPIMLIISPALLLSANRQRICVLLISTLISIYFMAKMVYQIDYIEHSYFEVNCTKLTLEKTVLNYTTYNNAEWVGFFKVPKHESLAIVLKGYIGLIVIFTIYSLVMYRQQRSRGYVKGSKDMIVFPEIGRKEADKDLIHCLKYLLNYGFFKFGIEVTLICLIGVIGSRMDLYAVLYALWLLALVSLRRRRQQALWPAFTGCVTVLVPLQYMLAVGFLPQFCISYPWSEDNVQMKHVRTWFFLPDADSPPHATKLIFDYFLLLFCSRQLRVFIIEKDQGDTYPGGSNDEVIGKNWETSNFVNPVPDFLGYVGSWLDIIKRMIFLGMLWLTLAIMFLTGTNRVNLFSIGYLIGSFIFLWQGTDFYLRPKDAILRWWSWLLRYNVCVVVMKVFLQIPGCLFSAQMQEHCCWLVQLLGIGCVDKFSGGNIARFLKMSYEKDTPCSVPQEDIGLAWDGVCFAFLVLQQRLFHSYYFYRVIDESKATTVLASRGAELIEELRQKQMFLQDEQESKILEKIKVKMERIKANQKKIQGAVIKKCPQHDDEEEEETQHGDSDQVPLVRGDSDASGRGYHTPESPASPRGFHTPVSEESAPPSRAPTPPAAVDPQLPPPLPALPPPGQAQGGPPSPSSALMTVSLDAYLEPRRISFESPPSSDLLPRAQSPEESYPVFSPPPRRRHTVASPSLLQRTSIISQSSRAEAHSHHTSTTSERQSYVAGPPTSHQKAIRSGDYYMFDEFDDTDINVEHESSSDEDVPKEMGIGKARKRSRPGTPVEREPVNVSDVDVAVMGRDQKDGDSAIEDYAPIQERETMCDKCIRIMETMWAFVDSMLVSITRHLMKYSRDYRYVSRTLSVEKKILKEKEGFGIGLREGSHMIWEPLPDTMLEQAQKNRTEYPDGNLLMPNVEMGRKLSEISIPEIRILAPSMERGLDSTPERRAPAAPPAAPRAAPADSGDDTSEHESAFSLQTTHSKEVSVLDDQDDSMFRQDRSTIVHLAYALWFAILAHTDVVCYIMVFINQIQSATILSIPLPLMVFLWGTLTIPRPTKTFWVTLIAYTEVIVLIKSMFQFEILPWNQKELPANMPFTAPRIIGIERKSNYALYDLLLLLIIFLHRFMLKSLGLWKESSPEMELHEDMEYSLTGADKQMVAEGRAEEVAKKYVQIHAAHGGHDNEINETNENNANNLSIQTPVNDISEETENRDNEEAGPSKPEDDHYKVNDDEEPIITVVTTMEETYKHYPQVIMLSVKRYLRPMHRFFNRMLAPGARVTADVYAYMFLCDFLNFLVVIFGFAGFGTHQGDGGVQAYLEENKVPIPFLIMLILQFGLIIVDRALYLRKFILGKILFQYLLIICIHVWMFFILPFITERTFNSLLPPPMWYMIKCIYLLLSAYQIRCGYPRRIIGNFLCKGYNYVNMLLFRGFMAVPFVFELRTLMDWIWTDTSMTLMDWLKMEDIFASVFLLKCSRYVEDEFPQPRGSKKSNASKYFLGGAVLAFVIAIIWFPLVIFAFGNTVGIANPPTDVTVKIRIGPFLPIYQMSAQSHNIATYSEEDYTHLSNLYARDRTAQTFLSNYVHDDVAVVALNPNSTMNWGISPPELERLENEIVSNATILIKFTFVLTHPSNSAQNPPSIEESREMKMEAFLPGGERNPDRVTLLRLLSNDPDKNLWLNVTELFPKFVKVFNKGTAKPAYQLMPHALNDEDETNLYRDVQLRMETVDDKVRYWRVRESCDAKEFLNGIPMNDCDMLVMFTFNDKLFPETLNIISGSGIIGLYTTFVFLASRLLRGFFSGIFTKIMFDDLPNVDRILQLCLDIYLVREALELALEEDLFAKLVFLYRSPETMIKWSRPKEENDVPHALPPSR